MSTQEWVGAAYTSEEARTPQQKELLALSDLLLSVDVSSGPRR
jgi:hypothetical protein